MHGDVYLQCKGRHARRTKDKTNITYTSRLLQLLMLYLNKYTFCRLIVMLSLRGVVELTAKDYGSEVSGFPSTPIYI
jgi:hypothetical protein